MHIQHSSHIITPLSTCLAHLKQSFSFREEMSYLDPCRGWTHLCTLWQRKLWFQSKRFDFHIASFYWKRPITLFYSQFFEVQLQKAMKVVLQHCFCPNHFNYTSVCNSSLYACTTLHISIHHSQPYTPQAATNLHLSFPFLFLFVCLWACMSAGGVSMQPSLSHNRHLHYPTHPLWRRCSPLGTWHTARTALLREEMCSCALRRRGFCLFEWKRRNSL